MDDFEAANFSDAQEGFNDLLEELDCYEEADEDGDGEPDEDSYDEESGYYADCDEDDEDDD